MTDKKRKGRKADYGASRRREAVEEWSKTPSANPRYRGATPAMVGRALLGYRPVTPPEKVPDDEPSVKPGV